MVNPHSNNTIWYCSVKEEKINSVTQQGLQCFSDPISDLISYRTPWITVTTEPDNTEFICEVDLVDITENDASWVFSPRDDKKRLRVFVDIPCHRVKIKKTGHNT